MPHANPSRRLYFLDNLRAAVILLVIVFHIALGYMAPPLAWWYVVDSQTSAAFIPFIVTVDVFIMPVMFWIAGYFTLPVLQRSLADIQSRLREGEGLTLRYSETEAAYERLFPRQLATTLSSDGPAG